MDAPRCTDCGLPPVIGHVQVLFTSALCLACRSYRESFAEMEREFTEARSLATIRDCYAPFPFTVREPGMTEEYTVCYRDEYGYWALDKHGTHPSRGPWILLPDKGTLLPKAGFHRAFNDRDEPYAFPGWILVRDWKGDL